MEVDLVTRPRHQIVRLALFGLLSYAVVRVARVLSLRRRRGQAQADAARSWSSGAAPQLAEAAFVAPAPAPVVPLEHALRCHPDALLAALWPREAFAALPATARAVSAALAPGELKRWAADGLWTESCDFVAIERMFLRLCLIGRDPRAQGASLAVAAARFSKPHVAAKELKWALRWRADPNQADASGWTPLIWAAHRGSSKLCRQLLISRADVNQFGKDGSTALTISCRCAHVEVVKELLEYGASIERVPIGNGNFDYHVGDDIMALLRQKKREAKVQRRIAEAAASPWWREAFS